MGNPNGPTEPREWPSLWRLVRRVIDNAHPVMVPVGMFLLPLLLCLSPLLVLYSLAQNARLVAYRVFHGTASAQPTDRAVAHVKRLRMWAALAVTLGVIAVFGTMQDIEEQFTERFFALLLTPLLLIVSGPVVITVLICCARPGSRPVMRRALREPLRQLACYVGALALVPAVIVGSIKVNPLLEDLLDPYLTIVSVLASVWSVFLAVFASIAIGWTGFGVTVVHPALPALLTSVLVWEIAAMYGPPPGPPTLAYVMLVSGPSSVTALACWEIHRLRTRLGVTLRGG